MKLAAATALSAALLFASHSALAMHGQAIIVSPSQESEIIFAYDPDDNVNRAFDFLESPYGFLRDLSAIALGATDALASFKGRAVVFFDADDSGRVTVSISRLEGEDWKALEPIELGGPVGLAAARKLFCKQLLGIDCAEVSGPDPRVVFDANPLTEDGLAPLISVGSFPPTATNELNLYDASSPPPAPAGGPESMDYREVLDAGAAGPARSFLGNLTDAIDFLNSGRTAPIDGRDVMSVPDEDAASPAADAGDGRTTMSTDSAALASGYDPALQFITLHCTGPGVMNRSQIEKYKKLRKKNKAHGYIMPDGDYIKLWSLQRNPNDIYATKTETCLRSQALGSMFNIELNYDCDWRPKKSKDPTDAQYKKLAEIIHWSHENVGPLGILSHTYVDMGLKRGHTDPQGRNGFDWQRLYDEIEALGGDLSGIHKVDPKWAKSHQISHTDRAHRFPPVINAPIPKGRDQCRTYAGD